MKAGLGLFYSLWSDQHRPWAPRPLQPLIGTSHDMYTAHWLTLTHTQTPSPPAFHYTGLQKEKKEKTLEFTFPASLAARGGGHMTQT